MQSPQGSADVRTAPRWSLATWIGLTGAIFGPVGLRAEPAIGGAEAESVTLLVPGMADPRADPDRPNSSPGGLDPTWRELVALLGEEGNGFGGVIRPGTVNIRLPECLDASRATAPDPHRARVFLLDFSHAAATDGIAFRAMELAQCIDELYRFHRKKIDIVAYSAGGVVARCVLQRACPGMECSGKVRRLITIAAPHLGVAVLENLGDLIGTRATSLKPSAALIKRLCVLDLPIDVCYASIVVRAVGQHLRAPAQDYDPLMSASSLARLSELPIDFQEGGDQVVHVRSQSLRWIAAAEQYEKETRRPIHSVLVRIRAKELGEKGALTDTVHGAATQDASVLRWVSRFLHDDGRLWTDKETPARDDLMRWQAEYTAFGAIESHARQGHLLRQVTDVEIDELRHEQPSGGRARPGVANRYLFSGTAYWRELSPGRSAVRGGLELVFDAFGRVTRVSQEIREPRSDR